MPKERDNKNLVQRQEGSISIAEMKVLIRKLAIEKGLQLMFWGPPGVGKTQGAIQELTTLGYQVRVVVVSLSDPTDSKGIPYVYEVETDGKVGEKRKFTGWATDSVFYVKPGEKVAFFFDELPNAAPSLVASFQKLLNEGKNGYVDISGCPRIAAGNDITHKAGTISLSSAQANRLLHFNVYPDAEGLQNYALAHNWNPTVVGYLKWRTQTPETILGQAIMYFDTSHCDKAWTSPRSIEFVSQVLSAGLPPALERLSVEGAVGKIWANDFYNVWMALADKIPDIDKIVAGEPVKVPTDPAVMIATISAVVGRLVATKHSEKSEAKVVAVFDNFCGFLCEEGVSAEFAVMGVRDAMTADNNGVTDVIKRYFDKPDKMPKWSAWQKKYAKLLRFDGKE